MRKRVDQLGVAQPEIQRSGADEIDVALPDVTNAERAQDQVGKTAQLYFYDWEPNVIGPAGTPAPSEATVTGGQRAGEATFGLPEYKAVLRAAKRPPILRKTDTTWSRGCTPQQVGGCIYGSWYLLDTRTKRCCAAAASRSARRGNRTEPLRGRLQTAAGGQDQGGARQSRHGAGAGPAAGKRKTGKVTNQSPNSWFVLNDNPVLTRLRRHQPDSRASTKAAGAPAPRT